jgi:hypothetical protein
MYFAITTPHTMHSVASSLTGRPHLGQTAVFVPPGADFSIQICAPHCLHWALAPSSGIFDASIV